MKNYGFIEPILDEKDFIFGSGDVDLTKPIQLNGQWDFLPSKEIQNLEGYETYNCTAFGSTNQIEIYLKKMFGGEYNFSDRALGIEAGTYPPGNSPQKVYQTIRKTGLVPDKMLPFGGRNVNEYYDKNKITPVIKKAEKKWLNTYSFQHDWVASGKLTSPGIMKTALQYSPLAVGIYAFAKDGEYYVRAGKDGDWVVIFGYEDGKYWKALTSYSPVVKKLAWDFGFYWVKRIHIEKVDELRRKVSILQQIVILYKKIIELLFKTPSFAPKQAPTSSLEPKPTILPLRWNNYQNTRKSVRMICDDEKLSLNAKNLITAVIRAESNFNSKAISKNANGSRDWGLCQFNDSPRYGWIGKGLVFENTDEVLSNPEKNVRIIIREFRKGNLIYWSAYKSKKYLKFLKV